MQKNVFFHLYHWRNKPKRDVTVENESNDHMNQPQKLVTDIYSLWADPHKYLNLDISSAHISLYPKSREQDKDHYIVL